MVLCAEDRVRGSPRLHTSFGDRISLRQLVERLECVLELHVRADALADALFKVLLHLLLDDEHDLFKARADRIEHGKVQNDVIVIVDRLDLFRTAETAAHAGCHDQKNRFFHKAFSS